MALITLHGLSVAHVIARRGHGRFSQVVDRISGKAHHALEPNSVRLAQAHGHRRHVTCGRGAVITDAATGNANVKALVYDDTYIPAQGEDVSTVRGAQSALAPATTNPASVFKLVKYADPLAVNVVDTYLLLSVVATDFAPDISPAKHALLGRNPEPDLASGTGSALKRARVQDHPVLGPNREPR